MRIEGLTLILALGAANQADLAPVERARALIREKKYSSAMDLLEGDAPQVVLEKIKLAVDDYAVCVSGESFGFRDLEPGETIEQVRGTTGNFKMVSLRLPDLEKKYGTSTNAELLTWLGHLAFFESHDCGGKENGTSARALYERARTLGAASPLLLRNLGTLYLEAQEPQKAVPLFRVAAAGYPEDPQFQYNFAYALLMDRKPGEAAEPIEKAVRLYRDDKLISEAALLAAFISWDNKDKNKAMAMAARADKLKTSNTYYIYTKLIGLYAEMGEWPRAVEVIDRLYELGPKNPRLVQDAVQAYVQFKHSRELDDFFKRELARQKDPESIGNLLFHRGQVSAQRGHKEAARSDLLQARESFSKALPPDHKVFAAIEAGLRDLN